MSKSETQQPAKTIKKPATSSSLEAAQFDGKYYYAVGRRKTSSAQARVYENDKLGGVVRVNGRPLEEYVVRKDLQENLLQPLILTGLEKKVNVSFVVRGGGMRGQAEAARLALTRALVKYDENLRSVLKVAKLLLRDPRSVERKKPGLRKARRAPQWSKR